MPLRDLAPIAFVPTSDCVRARQFYEHTLGLRFVKEDDFALVFELGPYRQMLRIARTPNFKPFPFTILGWQVDDIHATIARLKEHGVTFLTFDFLAHDPDGVWHAPDGAKVAWFQDPDGNTLSLSMHP
jgi:predicted enzyme related to lactoylglutathione lyase